MTNHSANLITAVYAVLTSNADLSALVGSRIYGGRAAQGSALPRIIFHEISNVAEALHDTFTSNDPGIDDTVLQFDCEGRTLTDARAVADALSDVLHGVISNSADAEIQGAFRESGGFAQPLDYLTGDGVTEAHRLSVDFRFLWRDAATLTA